MSQYLFTDNATTTLASPVSGGATSLALNPGDGAKFPTPGAGQVFTLRLGTDTSNEVVTCSARSTDTVTCSATAGAWIAGTQAILTLPSVVATSLVQRYEIATMAVAQTRRFEDTGSYLYCGMAPTGSSEAAYVWAITRMTLDASANIIATLRAASASWTNRASATYT